MALDIDTDMEEELRSRLEEILGKEDISFSDITPSKIPKKGGVYLISHLSEGAYYVGRSTNLSNRLYRNHLMGDLSNARLKHYLVKDNAVSDAEEAKRFIRENCWVRWVLEDDSRKRGAIEGYFTALFFPKYGISEEH